jgi:hypothetical protein
MTVKTLAPTSAAVVFRLVSMVLTLISHCSRANARRRVPATLAFNRLFPIVEHLSVPDAGAGADDDDAGSGRSQKTWRDLSEQ